MPKTITAWLSERDANAVPTPSTSSDVEEIEIIPSPAKKLKINVSNAGRVARRYRESLEKSRRVSLGGRRAKLALLPTLPLDILYEILGHLYSADLLNVARTTKAFRRILMHRSSTSIWKAARANVADFPECPPDMSEPAYAHLAFDGFCHSCPITSPIKHVPLSCVYWELRVRLCKSCAIRQLWSEEDVKFTEEMWDCLPMSERCGDMLCLRKDEARLERDLKALSDKPQDREVYMDRMMTIKEEREAHGQQCDDWACDVLEARTVERERIRQKRQLAIMEKLEKLDYEDVLDKMPTYHTSYTRRMVLFQDHPLVKQTKPLTDRSWTKIWPAMTKYMDGWRRWLDDQETEKLLNRRRGIACELLRTYKAANQTTNLMPSPADFCAFKPVKEVIERRKCDKPADTDDAATRTELALVITALPSVIEKWRENEVFSPLLFKLPCEYGLWSSRGAPAWGAVARALALAKTVFVCGAPRWLHRPVPGTACVNPAVGEVYEGMWWPEFAHHGCNGLGDHAAEARSDPSRALGDGYIVVQRRQWDADYLVFDDRGSAVASNVVRACNRDPDSATAEEMDNLDARLVCLKCSYGCLVDGERVFAVRTWRSSVQHAMLKHWGDATVRFQQISASDALLAHSLEDDEEAYHKKLGRKRPKDMCWLCTHCADTVCEPARMTLREMQKHIQSTHGKEQPAEGMDYFRAPDAPPRQPLTVKMAAHPANHETVASIKLKPSAAAIVRRLISSSPSDDEDSEESDT